MVLAAAGCADEETGPSQERSFPVETAVVGTETIEVALQAVGTVKAAGFAEIRAQVDGILSEVTFTEGESVEAGTRLAQIDNTKATASLNLAEAKLDSARAKLAVAGNRLRRARRLIDDELVSREEFESAESEQLAAQASVRENEAAVRLATRELEDYSLTAPFAGKVGQRLVDAGNYVQRGALLTHLMQTVPVEVVFSVPAKEHAALDLDRKVVVSTPEGGELATGRVAFIDPRIDPQTRMLAMKASVPNEDGALRPGQFVEVSLVQQVRENQTVVPEVAVVPYAGERWVFVVQGDRVERRRVEIGTRSPGQVEILSGLEQGETIVVSGQHRLSDEAKIEIAEKR